MKRLRSNQSPRKIRYYYCGEYGENTGRPHYHALLFNYSPKDKIVWSEREGNVLWTSEELTRLWGKGHVVIGEVTFETAAYTARYIMKKITGEGAQEHYQSLDRETGEIHQIRPEFSDMSRRPGIGAPWLEKYKTDVYPFDEVVVRGRPMMPPAYYDDLLEKIDEETLKKVKAARQVSRGKQASNNTRERLDVREKVAKHKLKMKGRKL